MVRYLGSEVRVQGVVGSFRCILPTGPIQYPLTDLFWPKASRICGGMDGFRPIYGQWICTQRYTRLTFIKPVLRMTKSKQKKYPRHVTVRLSEDDKIILELLIHRTGFSRSALLRSLIKAELDRVLV